MSYQFTYIILCFYLIIIYFILIFNVILFIFSISDVIIYLVFIRSSFSFIILYLIFLYFILNMFKKINNRNSINLQSIVNDINIEEDKI